MHIETAPAKINLTLDTLFKRDDGYHEVQMVMTEVDLNDRMTFTKRTDNKIVIETEHQFIPTDKRNLVYQAVLLMREAYGIKTGVNIFIEKNIPVSAGMAGGSTDAAATFRGINKIFDINAPLEDLAELSSKIGSDIPFCVYGGTALATGRGEKIERLPKPPHAWVVIAKPPLSVSTKVIYDHLKPGKNKPKSSEMVEAIHNKSYSAMIAAMKNDLQEVTRRKYSKVNVLLNKMQSLGADKAMMSGSGPTVFGIVQKERQAKQLSNALRGFCSEVYVVRLRG
ncbi:4-(cytidine 5'-diphospho)-2-C-methyl-D-erythritol kinase [Aliicoccus persicus]|uniref:4-diphosphocytidyl-2-C-methyl-D-erythritol kinase n=1 Tax=Aliicoccus persicus TaxID=930138 RepID=A0A662Z3M7_9STAP|nr:4-(cytidine 5'-diphospho)-2-C-methyl-D-erythritol kinase [Aliicoccus persicus]SEW05827.1 4-diphosphocytidyl-2-C-methyl-D-erythritol kinase [Aliicoccus persicus]